MRVSLLAPNETSPAWLTDFSEQILGSKVIRSDNDGAWSLDLIPNAAITPDNTVYQVIQHIPGVERAEQVSYIIVPDTGSHELGSLLTAPPSDLPIAASLIRFLPADGMASTNVEDAILEAYAHGGGGGGSGGIPIFNVTLAPYNAVGDGVADDSGAIRSAITAAHTAGGGIVYLPAGDYRLVANGLLLAFSGVSLIGAGEGATRIRVALDASIVPISVVGNGATPNTPFSYTFGNTVRDLSIIMDSAATNNTPAVVVQYAFEPELVNLFIQNFGDGVHVMGSNNIKARSISVYSIGLGTSQAYGFLIDSSASINASAYFENCWAVLSGAGALHCWHVEGGIIDDLFLNYCEGDGNGGNVVGLFINGGGAHGQDIHIAHFIADSVTYGIVAGAIAGTLHIDGGWIYGTGGGASVWLADVLGGHVEGLQMLGSNGAGIALGTSANTIVEGNVIRGAYADAILADTTQFCSISDNAIANSTGNGIRLGLAANTVVANNTIQATGTMTAGLKLDSGCLHARITGNVIDTGVNMPTPYVAAGGLVDISAMNNIGVPDTAPAGSEGLLSTNVYAPGSLVVYTLDNTLAALDTTNATLSFTVPSNGKVDVLVQVECQIFTTTTGGTIAFGLLNHSGGAQLGYNQHTLGWAAFSASSLISTATLRFHLTGLTPGSLQVDLAAGVTTGSGVTGSVYAQGYTGAPDGGKTSPLLMQAYAAV